MNRPANIIPKLMAPASRAAPIVYKMQETMIAMRRPRYSFAGDRMRAPATAPSGMPAFTRLLSADDRCKSFGRNKFAPLMSDWSRPDNMPPIDANATRTYVKFLGLAIEKSKRDFGTSWSCSSNCCSSASMAASVNPFCSFASATSSSSLPAASFSSLWA